MSLVHPAIKHPKDLARKVHSELKKLKGVDINNKILTQLFEIMFFSSLKTDELIAVIYSIVYINPDNPDPHKPENARADRWGYIRLGTALPFTVRNVTKLAKASDPSCSSLAIYHNENDDLIIWGLIDQLNRYSEYVNYESSVEPEAPGVFQASVESTGSITAHVGLKVMAELRQNTLVTASLDVFRKGPVYDAILPHIDGAIDKIDFASGLELDVNDWRDTYRELWISALCRLIIKIKSNNTGGAVLITSSTKSDGLNIKYTAKYSRLIDALQKQAGLMALNSIISERVLESMQNDEFVQSELYQKLQASASGLSRTKKEIDGALMFTSLLSRVDGVIVFNHFLNLKGFGIEIITKKQPESLFRSKGLYAYESYLEKLDYNYFGTRHRAMMRYCNNYSGSVGIVISHDGNVQAMTKVGDKLVVWEDINLNAQTYIPRPESDV